MPQAWAARVGGLGRMGAEELALALAEVRQERLEIGHGRVI
jgi:hypothetical protein